MKPPFLFIFFVIVAFSCFSQEKDDFNILFYNVENLFDTHNDSLSNDDEFLPMGLRHWTKKKYQKKINNISKVLLASCQFKMPDVVGLCEVENRYVLDDLINKSALSRFDYKIIHKDSPDPRGIDVALLYRSEKCKPIYYRFYPLLDNNAKEKRSREILYTQFLLFPNDTLHVFFNHWPSRYGGLAETEHKRIAAAHQLYGIVDQLKKTYQSPKVILMGDFNDSPQNKSMKEALFAVSKDSEATTGELINLSTEWQKKGTLKHRQTWVTFDQIIVSDNLLVKENWSIDIKNAQIVSLPFLFEEDPKFQGKRLFRTYHGMKYQGGYSDHLPINLRLVWND